MTPGSRLNRLPGVEFSGQPRRAREAAVSVEKGGSSERGEKY